MTTARLRHVGLYRVGMTLRTAVPTAYGTEHDRDVALIRVVTDDGEGWGECAALPEPTYHPEYVAGALHVLEHHLVPRVIGVAAHEDPVAAAVASVVGHSMAKAALEMAVLDARLRAAGRSLADELGATAPTVVAGRTIGLHRDLGALRAETDEAVAAGYRHLKLKITPDWADVPLAAVRSDHPDIGLRADANGSFDPLAVEAQRGGAPIDALVELGLDALEQPFPAGSDAACAWLCEHGRVVVALDEDITSVDAGVRAVRERRCHLVVAKPGRLGGLHAALALGREVGAQAWVGGMYETGVGRAANLALAACADTFAVPVDWSASDRYWATDLTEPHVLRPDGTIAVPTGPGLGVSPDRSTLARLVRDRRSLPG